MESKAKREAKREPWRPTFGEIVAVGALVGAAVMWLKPPSWEWGLPVTAILVALVVFTAVRHQSHPVRRTLVAAVTILILIWAAAGPIWKSFRAEYPRAAFSWPITLNPPAPPPVASLSPPDMPPTNLPGPALSKWGKVMFLCQLPENIPPQDPEAVLALIRRNFEIIGNATGLSMVINQITYGFRIDVTANNSEGQMRMGGLQRFTIQIERAAQGVFVTISIDIGTLGILSMMPIDQKSQTMFSGLVTQFTSISADKCRML
jgi:hypothetical protein